MGHPAGRKALDGTGAQPSWGTNAVLSPRPGVGDLAERPNPGPRNFSSQVQKGKVLVKNILGS